MLGIQSTVRGHVHKTGRCCPQNIVVAVGLWCFIQAPLPAGDCMDLTPCEAYAQATLVFRGTVVSNSETTCRIRVVVDKVYKGPHRSQSLLELRRGCAHPPAIGSRLLVYASPAGRSSEETIVIDPCAIRSADLAQDHMAFLEGLADRPQPFYVFGRIIPIMRRDGELGAPIGGVRIALRGVGET